jgi:hypothetical protein
MDNMKKYCFLKEFGAEKEPTFMSTTKLICKYKGKLKVKLFLCLTKHHAMKAYGKRRYSSTHS